MPDDVLKLAMERFRHSEAGSSRIREDAIEDVAFGRLGEQWPEEARRMRKLENRPCLTFNRIPTFVRRVINNARMNKPGIAVHPVDDGADFDTAQVIGGLIRAIERGSNATLAYDTAIDWAASGGFGFFRITTDYCHAESFDQEARIERVANPFAVHWDTSSTGFDASDWDFAFVSEMLTEGEFKRRYPKADETDFPVGRGDDWSEWDAGGAKMVRVAEYWTRDERKRKIVRLTDGRVMRADDLKKPVQTSLGFMPTIDALGLMGVTVNGERETSYYEVKRRMITGNEVLEESDWPGSMIPICPVWGEEVWDRGKRYFRSMMRDARDAQMMYNFMRSATAELIALQPRAPFLVPVGSIPPGQEQRWKEANTRSWPYLEYDPGAGPMPQRQPFATTPTGAMQEALQAADDMKSTIGIFDAALGARSNEQSGRAIMARQRESDVGTFHFQDNLSRAIEYAGKILVEIIPSLYSARRTIQIIGEDEAPRVIRVQQAEGEMPSADDPDGKLYNLSAGKYGVTVKAGANYATQREEAAQMLGELMRAAPQTTPALGDLMVQNMDWPGADEAAKRLQFVQMIELFRAVPPQVVAMLPPDTPGLPKGAQQIAAVVMQAQAPPDVPPGMPPGAMVDPMMAAPSGALPVSGGM